MRVLLAGTLLVLAFAGAGCGGGSSPSGNREASKSGQQVVADAVQAAEGASSLHMSGRIGAKGQDIRVDLILVRDKGATGSVMFGREKVGLVIVGTDAYIKASAAFYRQYGGSRGRAIASLVAGKWHKVPATNPQFDSIFGLANSKVLFDSLMSSHETFTNKGTTTYKGQKVVDIFNGPEGANLYVAATGTAYPVEIDGPNVALTWDGWNKPVTLTPPSGVVDLSHSGG